nr:MAG TPA: hypothetical protein [Caudoviricetes sp.]
MACCGDFLLIVGMIAFQNETFNWCFPKLHF